MFYFIFKNRKSFIRVYAYIYIYTCLYIHKYTDPHVGICEYQKNKQNLWKRIGELTSNVYRPRDVVLREVISEQFNIVHL